MKIQVDEFSTRIRKRQSQVSLSKILPVVFAVTSAKMPSVSLFIMHYRSNDCGCSDPPIGQILCVQTSKKPRTFTPPMYIVSSKIHPSVLAPCMCVFVFIVRVSYHIEKSFLREEVEVRT